MGCVTWTAYRSSGDYGLVWRIYGPGWVVGQTAHFFYLRYDDGQGGGMVGMIDIPDWYGWGSATGRLSEWVCELMGLRASERAVEGDLLKA